MSAVSDGLRDIFEMSLADIRAVRRGCAATTPGHRPYPNVCEKCQLGISFIPNEGPQEEFVSSDVDELLYGGAAGGGKTSGLVAIPLRWVDDPSFRGLILRRDTTQLKKLLDEAEALYPVAIEGADRAMKGDAAIWRFPSGANVRFEHCQLEKHIKRYDGDEFQYCVARGTPVLLASGEWRSVESIRPGDEVATLVGPRRVTDAFRVGMKPVVKVTGPAGSAVVSRTHPLLTSAGLWASPEALSATRCDAGGSTRAASPAQPEARGTQPGCRSTRLAPDDALAGQTLSRTPTPAIASLSGDGRTEGAACSGSRPAEAPPLSWSARLALFAPAFRSAAPTEPRGSLSRAQGHAPDGASAQDSLADCRAERGSDGERPLGPQESAQACTPSPVDAEERLRACLPAGGRASTPAHTLTAQFELRHPYTKEALVATEDVLLAQVEIAPAGEAEVFDLRVEGASHYVTWGGFVSQNCGYDELTHFTLKQFVGINARIRSSKPGLPRYSRGTTNPGGEGHEWVFDRWAAWLNPKAKIRGMRERRDPDTGELLPPAMPGEVLWFDPVTGERVAKGTLLSISRTFIPARVEDNPFITVNDPGYVAKLNAMDPVRRAQLRRGDWLVKPAAGAYFKRAWFNMVPVAPTDVIARARVWDLAATEDPKNTTGSPDWTVGELWSKTRDGRFFVENVTRFRGRPHEVDSAILNTAKADGRRVVIRLPQDPGQAGKAQAAHFTRMLAGFRVKIKPVTGDKVTRAGPYSSQVEGGNVYVVEGDWNSKFFEEHESFPEGEHDDQIDTGSDAIDELAKAKPFEGLDDYEGAKPRDQRESEAPQQNMARPASHATDQDKIKRRGRW